MKQQQNSVYSCINFISYCSGIYSEFTVFYLPCIIQLVTNEINHFSHDLAG